jgi:hypothetical protein
VRGKPALYRIVTVHDTVELPDDDDAAATAQP